VGHAYSTFEHATALALWWFARREIDIAVLEIGLGGRYDAVNAVENRLAIVTPIEMEHAAMLGGTLDRIAWHKAGVIGWDGQALTVPQSPVVMTVLDIEAQAKRARLDISGDVVGDAIKILHHREHTGEGEKEDRVHLPARLEWISVGGRAVLIDGGHTPLAAARLAGEIAPHPLTSSAQGREGDGGEACIVVGMLADKAAGAYLAHLDRPGWRVVLTTAPSHRAAPPDVLRAAFTPQHARVEIIPHLDDALALAGSVPERIFVVAGSLRTAAAAREAYGLLDAEELAEARATRAIFHGQV
jgi:dihydrofolate synthase/folylpolyglutamate synthase